MYVFMNLVLPAHTMFMFIRCQNMAYVCCVCVCAMRMYACECLFCFYSRQIDRNRQKNVSNNFLGTFSAYNILPDASLEAIGVGKFTIEYSYQSAVLSIASFRS